MPIPLPPVVVPDADVARVIAEAEEILFLQGPTEEVLIALAEAHFSMDEFDAAVRWYAAAARCTARSEIIVRDIPHTKLRARYRALRQLIMERPVEWHNKCRDDHKIYVMTCAGRERLFDRTLESLGPWPIMIWRDTYGGQAPSFFALLRRAARESFLRAARPDTAAITIIEDDVVLAPDALQAITRLDIDDDLALVSWFTTDVPHTLRYTPQISCVPARDYRFHQCITLPMRTVHELLASEALQAWTDPHGADRIYAKVFPDRLCGIVYPNIGEHVGGDASLVGNIGERRSGTFVGEDRSALELVR